MTLEDAQEIAEQIDRVVNGAHYDLPEYERIEGALVAIGSELGNHDPDELQTQISEEIIEVDKRFSEEFGKLVEVAKYAKKSRTERAALKKTIKKLPKGIRKIL
ncbi:hypothetical protein [Salinisphaera japonica]|nr:hypothetical protein [Salinisphaera japonica]